MKHELGISVYPDLSPLSEIKEYIKLASQYGATRVFSSMFSVEGTNEEILEYFKEMIEIAHKYDMKVALDVNPQFFEQIGASVDDLSVFSSINVDILRMDLSYGVENDQKLINNSHGITIEFNSSFKIVNDLIQAGTDASQFLVCHNFYPQRYTGMKWKDFLTANQQMKSVGDVRISAFISSNADNTHGVWNAKDGLPTVERLRGLPIDLQMRIMLATGNVDDILIGNAYASEEEFKALQEALIEVESKQENPLLKMLSDSGALDLSNSTQKKLRVILNENMTQVEKDILFNFYPHLSFGDSSEWMWRNRLPRFIYSQSDKTIPYRQVQKEYFEPGDVVIVNDNYKHYAGEVQIVLLPMENDGTRNLVAQLDKQEFQMMELINPADTIVFLNK